MEKVQVAVIGAGVVGLAVSRALAMAGKEVLILEREKTFGTQTSSRNSEVVHGGLYYPSGSLKAKFCVDGRHRLYDYCNDRDIFCDPIGKLVVATSEDQIPMLQRLKAHCHRNGYREAKLFSEADAKFLEPNIAAAGGALWSPSTGIVDSHGLMLSLLGDAENAGASMVTNTPVQDASIECDHDIRLYAGGIWISCETVINCAGLWADEIASMLHSNTAERSKDWSPPKQYFAKGNYFALNAKSPFRHLIYPVPDPQGGLGVHATLDCNHQVRFGPDVEWLDPDTAADQIDYQPSKAKENDFYTSIRSYWPALPDNSLSVDYAGVRPKLSHPKIPRATEKLQFHDFNIAGTEEHGVKGLIHLFGIESPGLTSSLSLAEFVARATLKK